MVSAEPFIEGWNFIQTLGEGAYGEVKLAVNNKQDYIAVKIINNGPMNSVQPDCKRNEIDTFIQKEIAIHKALNCKNIIRFFGMRKQTDRIYIFLEYVSGGELFDRIEPDIGIPRSLARFYFTQLLTGIEYIHSKGITHRDIKPENILFDSQDVLKICDFGLATMFRFQGKERKLTRRCGTICYVAPEVIHFPYDAQPAELWSCGIVLFSLFFGQLPWDEPTNRDQNYMDWVEGNTRDKKIWSRLDKEELSLFRGIISIDPKDRLNIEDIRQHGWFNEKLPSTSSIDVISGLSDGSIASDGSTPCTQPTKMLSTDQNPDFSFHKEVFLSQPMYTDEIYLGTQFATQTRPSAQQTISNFLTKRLTRIFLDLDLKSTINSLTKILSELRIDSKLTSDHSNACIRVLTTDLRGQLLQFNLLLYSFSLCTTMVDFRRTKGDALEFKRKFKLIEHAVKDVQT
ncbi:Serine/threonine-protein kinase Chk1-like [Oopsacas minuta]|uniref:non-specific serine/threonine protein kinase n=1 Tax=Oopsacas minuta TaxID=111878 RepID=A0AAV7JNV9_9METZ|nr:Serine/threonine-protein kinase Chk1-like [Oopsacas minuta]